MNINTLGAERVQRLKSTYRCRYVGIRASVDFKAAVKPDAQSGDIISTVATTDAVDLDDEVLVPGGADLSYLERNRKVFVDHWYDVPSCVGGLKTWKLSDDGKSMQVDVRMLVDSPYPLTAAVVGMARQIGIGTSVGFEPIDWGDPRPDELKLYPKAKSIVRKYRLLEISFTAMPCNVTCQSVAVASSGADLLTRGVDPDRLRLLRLLRPLPL